MNESDLTNPTEKARPLIQESILHINRADFTRLVNAKLRNGWWAVPKTFDVVSADVMAGHNVPAELIDANGMTLRPHYFIVLETYANNSSCPAG